MRIGVITSQFPPNWGGVGNGVHRQVEALSARGHDIVVFTRKLGRDQVDPELPGKVTVRHVPMVKLPMFFTVSFADNAVKALLKERDDFDVIHSHSNICLLRQPHYRTIPWPIVTTMHGTWKGERSMIYLGDITLSISSLNDLAVLYISSIFDVFEDYAIRHSNAVIIESDSEIAAIADRNVTNDFGRLVKLPAGIDTETFHPSNHDPDVLGGLGVDPSRPVILFVGRLAARKGVFDLLEIFSIVRGEVDGAQLVVVGEGPQFEGLKRRSRELGIEGSTFFTGPVPFDVLKKIFATADVLVFPSFWEGQGLVPGEAMSSGTPCVATAVGWVPELIREGLNGFTHQPRDNRTAAVRIAEILNDDGLRRRMGSVSRHDIVKRWDWRYHIDVLERLFLQVQDDGPRTIPGPFSIPLPIRRPIVSR